MAQIPLLAEPVDADVAGGTPRDLLAACLSLRAGEPLVERLASLTAAEWEVLVARALRHEVAPLVGARLADEPGLAVPPAAARAMEEAYAATSSSNARMYRGLAEVARELGGAGIPTVVLKGAYLARGVYGDPAFRCMEDVDLLVPRPDIERAHRVLLELGYRPENHPHLEPVYACNHHLVPMQKEGELEVELHWSIDAVGHPRGGGPPASPFTLRMDDLWARVRPAGFRDAELLAFSPEDLLLHLCLHASFHHGFNITIQKLCDIAWAARAEPRVDWERVEATARAWNAAKLVAVTLRLTREILHAPIPAGLLPEVEWRPADERILPVIREYVLRAPRRDTDERARRRRVINPWLGGVTGMLGRGAE
jgi:hypothetical protein